MARDNVELKKEIIQVKTQQQKIQIENAELGKEIIKIKAKCNEYKIQNTNRMQ